MKKKILDYTGKYVAKDGETVVKANPVYASKEDEKGFDEVIKEDEKPKKGK
jgi:hypothetical protein